MKPLTLEDIIRDVSDLPSLPAIVLEVMSTMDQPDVSTQLLADKISLDQAISAKTLRLANSSFYGMSSRVTTVQQAIAVLGLGTVRALVTATALTGTFGRDGGDGLDFELFWQQAIATALCARNLAPLLRLDPESAFLAGLLHDIGQLVMATQCPDKYADVLAYRSRHDCALRAAELAVTGIEHATVGAALIRHWRFPQAIVEAVEQHHAPASGTSLALVIHLADALAHALDITGDASEAVPVIAADAWNRLALEPVALARMLDNINREYESVCLVLTR